MKIEFDPESTLDIAKPMANDIKTKMICPIHKKRVRLSFDYDYDGANAYIVFYCCRNHAEMVADSIKEIEMFNNIEIKNL